MEQSVDSGSNYGIDGNSEGGERLMNGRLFGYARVSSAEQNMDRQIFELQKYVPTENIIVDKASGKNLERTGYLALKGPLGLRAGDVLYVTSLDRLSRNKQNIKEEMEWFKSRNVRLMILDLPTSMITVPEGQEWILDMITNILIEVLASIAEQERLTIRKRQSEGIAAAKKKGKHLGRPRIQRPAEFEEVYKNWKSGSITAKDAMRQLKMSNSTFYRAVTAYEKSE